MERIPADGWQLHAGHVERYRYAAAQVRAGETVNDVACGVGYGAVMLCTVAGVYRGYDRPGVPDSRFAGSGVRFVVCDLDDPAFAPDACDVTVCLETLEHVADPRRLAATLARTTLRALVVSVPTVPTCHGNPFHRHDFTAEEIPPMFTGFRVADRWAQPAELAHVWLLERRAA